MERREGPGVHAQAPGEAPRHQYLRGHYTTATSACQDSSFLRNALEQVALGRYVFPMIIKPNGKKHPPEGSNGVWSATQDIDRIREWGERFPDACVGIRCGVRSDQNDESLERDRDGAEYVLDFDNEEALASFVENFGEIPKTYTVKTSRGWHFHFRYPGKGRIASSGNFDWGDGEHHCEILSEGKCAITAGDRPDGASYEVVDDTPPVRWPAFERILEARGLYSRDGIFRKPAVKRVENDAEAPHGGNGRRIPEDGSGVIPQGERNNALASIAGMMRSRGLSPEAIEAALVAENQARCRPPLSDVEVRAIAKSICRYPAGEDVVMYRRGSLIGFTYVDVDGTPLYRVMYDEEKGSSFFEHPEENGEWVRGRGKAPGVLYNLPAVVKTAAQSGEIYIVEGERNAQRLIDEGLCATTNPGGPGQWKDEFSLFLQDAHCRIIPDNDEDGRAHAQAVAGSIFNLAGTVKLVELPGLPPGGGVGDWLDSGHTVDELRTLAAGAPLWGMGRERGDIPSSAAMPADASFGRDVGASPRKEVEPGKTRGETKRFVAAKIVNRLLAENRLYLDEGEDMYNGGRGYIRLHDGSLSPFNPETEPIKLVLHEFGLNSSQPDYRFVAEEVRLAILLNGKRIKLGKWQERRDGNLYISCGPRFLVRVSEKGLEKLPNGTDDVWFGADYSYPEWAPTEPVHPLKLSALSPPLVRDSQVPGYSEDVQRWLLSVWIPARLTGIEDLPILILLGNKGGGKTKTAEAITRVLHGHKGGVRSIQNDKKDFLSYVRGRAAAAIDNLDSDIPKWFADQIASLSTGGTISVREYYTTLDCLDLQVNAGFILTSRTASFVRDDIAERCIPIMTGAFADRERKSEEMLRAEVERNRDGVLSWAAEIAWEMLQLMDQAPEGAPVRFVDFAKLAWAFTKITGDDTDSVWGRLKALRQVQSLLVWEGDDLLAAILEHFDEIATNGVFSGTPTELVRALERAGGLLNMIGGGRVIARKLRGMEKDLATMGFDVSWAKQGNNTIFTLCRRSGEEENAGGDVPSDDSGQNSSCPPVSGADSVVDGASPDGDPWLF